MLVDAIGWISNFLFAMCAFPQAWQSYKQGHSKGIHTWFLLIWAMGEIGSLFFSVMKDLPLSIITNYIINFFLLLVIIKYKFWERLTTEQQILKDLNEVGIDGFIVTPEMSIEDVRKIIEEKTKD